MNIDFDAVLKNNLIDSFDTFIIFIAKLKCINIDIDSFSKRPDHYFPGNDITALYKKISK